jgi:hypothetical protein
MKLNMSLNEDLKGQGRPVLLASPFLYWRIPVSQRNTSMVEEPVAYIFRAQKTSESRN